MKTSRRTTIAITYDTELKTVLFDISAISLKWKAFSDLRVLHVRHLRVGRRACRLEHELGRVS